MLNKTTHSIDEIKRYIFNINTNEWYWRGKAKSLADVEIIDYGTPDNSNCLNIIHKIRYKKYWYSKSQWYSANTCPGSEFEKELKKIRIQLRKEKLQKIKNYEKSH